MEEVIGFGLLGLIVFTVGLGIKRWLKPKKDLFEYEDEIYLDVRWYILVLSLGVLCIHQVYFPPNVSSSFLQLIGQELSMAGV